MKFLKFLVQTGDSNCENTQEFPMLVGSLLLRSITFERLLQKLVGVVSSHECLFFCWGTEVSTWKTVANRDISQSSQSSCLSQWFSTSFWSHEWLWLVKPRGWDHLELVVFTVSSFALVHSEHRFTQVEHFSLTILLQEHIYQAITFRFNCSLFFWFSTWSLNISVLCVFFLLCSNHKASPHS
jgi:hypothetical protein